MQEAGAHSQLRHAMAADVDPAHVSVVHLSLNMVQPTMSAFHATPATPMELLALAPITPARKVPWPEIATKPLQADSLLMLLHRPYLQVVGGERF